MSQRTVGGGSSGNVLPPRNGGLSAGGLSDEDVEANPSRISGHALPYRAAENYV